MDKGKFFLLSRLPQSQLLEIVLLVLPIPFLSYLSRFFGLGWDEPVQRLTGAVNLKYVANLIGVSELPKSANAIPNLSDYGDKFFGPIYEMFLLAMEYVFKITDAHHLIKGNFETFQFRHLITVIVCYSMSVCGYLMLREIFGKRIAFLSLLLYWSFPRIFADSFYNSKDAIAASGVSLLFFLAFKFSRKESNFSLINFWIASGVLTTIRLPVVLVVIVLYFFVILPKSKSVKKTSLSFFFFGGSMLISWPFLWASPVKNLIDAFRDMMSRDWNGEVLFFGELYRAEFLPWNYLLGWISVTVPVLCLLMCLIGLFLHGKTLMSINVKPRNSSFLISQISIWILVCANLYFIVLRPTIYDGWRHFYFLYPVMIFLSSAGISWLVNLTRRKALAFICLLILISTSYVQLFRVFPYGNLYFNSLMSKQNLESRMELDYWGLANVRILKSLSNFALNNGMSKISIGHNSYNPIESSRRMLSSPVNFDFVDAREKQKDCLYITNYRLELTPNPEGFILIDNLYVGPYNVASLYAKGSCSVTWSRFRF